MPPVSIPALDALSEDNRASIAKLAAPVNVGVVSAHSPALVAPMVDYAMAVLKGLSLSARHRELVIMLVASHTRSEYLYELHVTFSRPFGLSDEEMAGRAASADPTEALVLRAGTELLTTDTLTEETSAALHEVLGEASVVEIACVVGYYRLLASLANAARLPVDNPDDMSAVAVLAESLSRTEADR